MYAPNNHPQDFYGSVREMPRQQYTAEQEMFLRSQEAYAFTQQDASSNQVFPFVSAMTAPMAPSNLTPPPVVAPQYQQQPQQQQPAVASAGLDRDQPRLSSDTSSKDPELLKSRVFIGNLNTVHCTRQELIDMCKQYGNLKALSLLKGYAFVQYESQAEAEIAIRCLNGHVFFGQKLDVRSATIGRGSVISSSSTGPIRRPKFDYLFGGQKIRADTANSRNRIFSQEIFGALRDVEFYDHGKEDTIICGSCRTTFKSIRPYINHRRQKKCNFFEREVAPSSISCFTCKEEFGEPWLFIQHLIHRHSINLYRGQPDSDPVAYLDKLKKQAEEKDKPKKEDEKSADEKTEKSPDERKDRKEEKSERSRDDRRDRKEEKSERSRDERRDRDDKDRKDRDDRDRKDRDDRDRKDRDDRDRKDRDDKDRSSRTKRSTPSKESNGTRQTEPQKAAEEFVEKFADRTAEIAPEPTKQPRSEPPADEDSSPKPKPETQQETPAPSVPLFTQPLPAKDIAERREKHHEERLVEQQLQKLAEQQQRGNSIDEHKPNGNPSDDTTMIRESWRSTSWVDKQPDLPPSNAHDNQQPMDDMPSYSSAISIGVTSKPALAASMPPPPMGSSIFMHSTAASIPSFQSQMYRPPPSISGNFPFAQAPPMGVQPGFSNFLPAHTSASPMISSIYNPMPPQGPPPSSVYNPPSVPKPQISLPQFMAQSASAHQSGALTEEDQMKMLAEFDMDM